MLFAKEYKRVFNEIWTDNFDDLLEMEDDEFKSEMESYRSEAANDLLSDDFDWMMRK